VGVVDSALRARIEELAKGLFYPDRSYPRVLALAVERGCRGEAIDALRAFIGARRVDQKRLDALALLAALRECREAGRPPQPVAFSFAHTEAWDQVVDWAAAQPPLVTSGSGVAAELLAAEVRLEGIQGLLHIEAAFSGAAAEMAAHRSEIPDRASRRVQVEQRLRERRWGRVADPSSLEQQLVANGLTAQTWPGFLDRLVQVEWFRERCLSDLDRHIADVLREAGAYERVCQRAQEKERLLAEHGLQMPNLADAGLDRSRLLEWYFAERLGRPAPEDLPAFLASVGLADIGAWEQEALREWLYLRLIGGAAPADRSA
jgi:hypothetical protein